MALTMSNNKLQERLDEILFENCIVDFKSKAIVNYMLENDLEIDTITQTVFDELLEDCNVKVCDVSLAVVDGMGNEYENEFNLKNNYSEVIDMSSGAKCSIEDNMIKDVKLVDGVAQINLKLKDNYNTA